MSVTYHFPRTRRSELIDDNNHYNCHMLYIYLRHDGFQCPIYKVPCFLYPNHLSDNELMIFVPFCTIQKKDLCSEELERAGPRLVSSI